MNFENQGQPIARVKFEGDKKKDRTLSVEKPNDPNVDTPFTELMLQKPKEMIQHLPNKKRERDILYICGQSGSGKSYYTMQYANEYKKMYPKNPIYLFSSLNEDKGSIDKVKGLKRIKLQPELLRSELTTKDFENSLVIFDDTDVIRDKLMRLKVLSILNMLLETGRHSKTSVVLTYHLPTNGLETRRILNEAHSVTIFPANCGGRAMKYLLENYFGMSKEDIKRVKKLPSRWVTIIKTYPNVVLYEKGAYVLNDPDVD